MLWQIQEPNNICLNIKAKHFQLAIIAFTKIV